MKECPGPEFPTVSSFNLSDYKLSRFIDLAFAEKSRREKKWRNKTSSSPLRIVYIYSRIIKERIRKK